MELRKIIVYTIFAAVVIYGIYFHFLSGETAKNTPPAVRTEAPIKASIPAQVEKEYVEPESTVKLDKAATLKNKPRRNPFKKSKPVEP